jgi:hypothetical protein
MGVRILGPQFDRAPAADDRFVLVSLLSPGDRQELIGVGIIGL